MQTNHQYILLLSTCSLFNLMTNRSGITRNKFQRVVFNFEFFSFLLNLIFQKLIGFKKSYLLCFNGAVNKYIVLLIK